jgi:hypothetical protein
MEIKPAWLLEGAYIWFDQGTYDDMLCFVTLQQSHRTFSSLLLLILIASIWLTNGFSRPADLEQLAVGDKKMPKAVGSAGESSRL